MGLLDPFVLFAPLHLLDQLAPLDRYSQSVQLRLWSLLALLDPWFLWDPV